MDRPNTTLPELFQLNRKFADELGDVDFDSHTPSIVTVSCCDARVSQELLFGSETGENFTIGKIGNVVSGRDADGDAIVAGSLLYPIQRTSPSFVFIVGHTDCGAVTAAWKQASEGVPPEDRELQSELDLLIPVVEEGLEQIDQTELFRDEQITRLVEYNVDHQVETLHPRAGDVTVVGVVCDLHGYYADTPGWCHLINYGGNRNPAEVPDDLRPYFSRKLTY
jgi:carbonic anhydrase